MGAVGGGHLARAVVCIALLGCADSTAVPLSLPIDPNSKLLEITSAEGRLYVDLQTDMVSDGFGRALQLTSDQTATLLKSVRDDEVSGFHFQQWSSVLDTLSLSDPDTTGGCRSDGTGCAQVVVPISPPQPRGRPTAPRWRFAASPVLDEKGRRIRRAAPSSVGSSQSESMLQVAESPSANSLNDWNCRSIARTVWAAREAIRSRRANPAGVLLDALKGEFGTAIASGEAVSIESVPGLAAEFALTAAETERLRIATTVLTSMAIAQECFGATYYVGTNFVAHRFGSQGEDAPPIGAFHQVCTMELWRITSADGQTTSTVWVENCDIIYQEFS